MCPTRSCTCVFTVGRSIIVLVQLFYAKDFVRNAVTLQQLYILGLEASCEFSDNYACGWNLKQSAYWTDEELYLPRSRLFTGNTELHSYIICLDSHKLIACLIYSGVSFWEQYQVAQIHFLANRITGGGGWVWTYDSTVIGSHVQRANHYTTLFQRKK